MRIVLNISLFLGFLVLGIGCNSSNKSKVNIVNWEVTYDSRDKIPFGMYIMKEELPEMLPNTEMEIITKETPNYFSGIQYGNDQEGTYMYIYDRLLQDYSLCRTLQDFVSVGNAAFIASYEFENLLDNSLIQTTALYTQDSDEDRVKDKTLVALTVDAESWGVATSDTIHYKGVLDVYYFSTIPDEAEVIGYIIYEGESYPNFLRIPVENGFYYLNSTPLAFTNFEHLRGNHYKYVEQAMSFIPKNGKIHWDNERIYQRYMYGTSEGGLFSYLSFAMEHDALRYSIFLLFIALFLFLLFNTSRKQQPIPRIKPYQNESIAFNNILANLYINHDNQHALVKVKINYFLDFIKTKYYLETHHLNQKFIQNLSQKSGVRIETCQDLVETIKKYQQKKYCDRIDFYKLSQKIQLFHLKSN